MEYKAVREIKKGDMICFPYIGDIWETPTHIRRKELEESKSFLCRCERCMQPDLLRLVKCQNCGGSAVCTYDPFGIPSWMCDSCEAEASRTDCETLEQSCDGVIKKTDLMLMMRGCNLVSTKGVRSGM